MKIFQVIKGKDVIYASNNPYSAIRVMLRDANNRFEIKTVNFAQGFIILSKFKEVD